MSTAKKRVSKKHDPKKLFTVITVSRAPDDPRLTDKVCQDIADSLYDAYCNCADDSMDDAEHQMYIDCLEQFEDE